MDQTDKTRVRLGGSATLDPNGNVSEWFAKLMFVAAEAVGVRLSEARIRIYAQDLAAYEKTSIERAFTKARRHGSGFFPSSAELIRHIEPSMEDRALMAWDSLTRAAEDVGGYRALAVEDQAAANALLATFGSWPEFCAYERGPELLVKRQAFLARYREELRVSDGRGDPVVLRGALPNATGEVGVLAIDGSVSLRSDRSLTEGSENQRKQLTEGEREDGET